MDEGGKMEKEVKPYYEDDYQSLDEVSTTDLLEMKEGALNDLNESERTIHRINQILASREVYDKWQDVIYKHYVDFKPGHRGQAKAE